MDDDLSLAEFILLLLSQLFLEQFFEAVLAVLTAANSFKKNVY